MPTPMRRQYLSIKKRYPDTIVFFRLGDFYETFDEDAKILARECNIVLTSRPISPDRRVPLAGVPHHAAEGYIARLIKAGHKVAIVEQVEEAATSKGLVAREVVRVVTPGTVVEPSLLEEKRNNYLCALYLEGGRAGFSYVDITTADFAATQVEGEAVEEALARELARLEAAECLVPAGFSPEMAAQSLRNSLQGTSLTPCEAWHFHLETARDALLGHFKASSLRGFGLEGYPLAIQAAGAILQYLGETQAQALPDIRELRAYSLGDFMGLDAAARRNLEIFRSLRDGGEKGSLIGVLDQTRTAMGGRLLRRWLGEPLLDDAAIALRQDAVGVFYGEAALRAEVREKLGKVADLERLSGRLGQGRAGPRDLVAMAEALEAAPQVGALVQPHAGKAQVLGALKLDGCPQAVGLIRKAIATDPPVALGEGRVISPGFSPELDELLKRVEEAKDWMAGLEARERERTGIRNLKVGYNKVFDYYLEVTRPNLPKVPPEYIRRQTLVNGERFITPELKEYESLILNAEEEIASLERRLFAQVLQQLQADLPRISSAARALAELDVYASLAEVAAKYYYTRPLVDDSLDIEIVAGRHPVVELALEEEPFIPNDTRLSSGEGEILILTGPNMAGKSTYLRQVALIVLLAQVGSFIPAERARLGLVDRIFTRIGAQDEIAQGASTFMVEMMEVANILHNATGRSLLILDEVGRGTATYDGLSIAWAVVEYLHSHPRLRARTLFATHFHELTELAEVLPRVRNYSMAVREEGDRVVFLRKVVPGGMDRSYGIHVAKLAGVPRAVTGRAEEILSTLQDSRGSPLGGREGAFHPSPGRQLELFPRGLHPVLEELKGLDLASLTPLEALNRLYEWQKRLSEG